MTQNEKDLLLKDLCSRLPYGVKAYVRHYSKLDRKWYEGIYTIKSAYPVLNEIFVTSETGSVEVIVGYDDYEIKLYLFPMSSMTEEQRKELFYLSGIDIINGKFYTNNEFTLEETLSGINWLLKNHFDINGLIPMGLAINSTGLNIY